jgi:hypothetical protein
MADRCSLSLAVRTSGSGDRSDIRSSLLVVVVASIASYGKTTTENDEMDTRSTRVVAGGMADEGRHGE